MLSNFIKLPRRFNFFYYCLINSRQNFIIAKRPNMNFCKMTLCDNLVKLSIRNNEPFKTLVLRGKTTSRKKILQKQKDDDDDDDEEESDEDYNFKGDEVRTFETQAARVDKILKLCFKGSRKDIDDMFYQTRIRVNGKILKKKSANVNVGDEIDMINGFVNDNSKLINVNKIEILNIKNDVDNLKYIVKIKKSKSLAVQNYTGNDEWRG